MTGEVKYRAEIWNDTGMALCRLGMRAIEGEFQARKLDKLGELIEAVRKREETPVEG